MSATELFGSEVADVDAADLRQLETTVLSVIWGPCRGGRAK